MSQATRAALMSALIFPRAGLLMLRQYRRGLIFALPVLIILIMLFKQLFALATQIGADLNGHPEQLDILQVSEQLHTQIYSSAYWVQGKWIILASWLLSIVSSYANGHQLDLAQAAEQTTTNNPNTNNAKNEP